MTYELLIKADSKEELLAILQNQPIQINPNKLNVTDEKLVEKVEDIPVTTTKAEPTNYSMDDLARAAATLMEDKDNPEGVKMLQELLAYYNVPSLVKLPKEQYNDFAEKLKALGVEVDA